MLPGAASRRSVAAATRKRAGRRTASGDSMLLGGAILGRPAATYRPMVCISSTLGAHRQSRSSRARRAHGFQGRHAAGWPRIGTRLAAATRKRAVHRTASGDSAPLAPLTWTAVGKPTDRIVCILPALAGQRQRATRHGLAERTASGDSILRVGRAHGPAAAHTGQWYVFVRCSVRTGSEPRHGKGQHSRWAQHAAGRRIPWTVSGKHTD